MIHGVQIIGSLRQNLYISADPIHIIYETEFGYGTEFEEVRVRIWDRIRM